MERIETHAHFGGTQEVWQHTSTTLGGDARVGVYLPPQAAAGPCPVVYFLSGLTCTEQNFITKAGAQRAAAELGLILVAPDTSPRGKDVPDDDAGLMVTDLSNDPTPVATAADPTPMATAADPAQAARAAGPPPAAPAAAAPPPTPAVGEATAAPLAAPAHTPGEGSPAPDDTPPKPEHEPD